MNKKALLVLGLVIIAGFGVRLAQASELATVDGQVLTDRDLRAALGSMNEGMRENVLKDPNTRRQILGSVIDQEVLVVEAVREKLDQDQEYKDALSQFRKQFLASRALQKNLGTKMTESAAKKYYESNKNKYNTDEVHAMHILVKEEEQAKEVLKAAKAQGADFQAVAVKYSVDPSVKNNRGDLGSFGRNAPYDSGFMDAAFGGQPGDIVGPVKTAFGYHIIKVVDKKLGKTLPYNDIEQQVRKDYANALKQTYVSKLRETAKIKVNDAALDKI